MGEERPPEYYDEHISNFLVPYEESMWRSIYDAVVSFLPADKTVRIVDVGCGTGRFAEAARRAGYTNYVGFDFSPKRIEEARRYLPEHDFRVQDIFSDETAALIASADVIVITEVLEHIEKDVALLTSIPAGKTVLFSVPNFGGPTHVRKFHDLNAIKARFFPALDIEWDTATTIVRPNKRSKIFICRSVKKSSSQIYWESRETGLYLQAVKDIVKHVGLDAESIIDVGSAACPYLDWYDWIPHRASLDSRRPYVAPGIRSIKSDFLTWQPDRKYDVLTCLQAMARMPDAEAFARKILEVSKIAIVSFPYKWDPKHNKTHVHDPVDEEKILSWFGRQPSAEFLITEVVSNSTRIIHVYEDEAVGRWRSLKGRRPPVEGMQSEAATA